MRLNGSTIGVALAGGALLAALGPTPQSAAMSMQGAQKTVIGPNGLRQETVMVTAVGSSAVHGQAHLTVGMRGLAIRETLTGLRAHARYQAYLNAGAPGHYLGHLAALPLTATGSGTAATEVRVPGVRAIPETGWYLAVSAPGTMAGMAMKNQLVAVGTLGLAIGPKTAVLDKKIGPYLVSLQIGPLGRMITPGQAKMGMTGDIMTSGRMLMAYRGHAVNHHLEVHLFRWKTGNVVADVKPTVRIAAGMHAWTGLAMAGMYGSQTGMADFHYGNNVYLKPGPVKVDIGIPGQPPTTFAVTVGAGAAMKMGGM